MKRISSGFAIAIAFTGAACATPAADMAGKAPAQPNIVFIHVDDLGYHDLGFTGSRIHQTPAIDAFARQSISFSQAYSSYPRCVPSRYGLLTATYPTNEDHGNLGAIPENGNFVRQLKNAGYRTFFAGKWHLGSGKSGPTGFGFDQSFGAGESGGTDSHLYPFNIKRKEGATGEKAPIPDVVAAGKKGDYLADLLTSKTLDFIGAESGKPFFAMLSFYAVHTPLEAKPGDRARNATEIAAFDYGDGPEYVKEGAGRRKMRQDDADYAGMVENVDENVARVLTLLREKGLEQNTIVVVSSDHGGLSNDGENQRRLATTNEPLRAGKGWLYEGGIRVPLLMRWPARIEPRVESRAIILGMDVMPTLLDLATDGALANVDGESFEDVIDANADWSRRTVYWHSSKARPYSTGDYPASAIREGDYKLVDFFTQGRTELYNLANDPSERADLSATEPAKAKSMKQKLDAWRAAEGVSTSAAKAKTGKANRAKRTKRATEE